MSRKSLCLRSLSTFFVSNIPFFIEWSIGLDWRYCRIDWIVEFDKESNLVSIKLYWSYLEYFQEGNSLLGCRSVCSDRKILLQIYA